MNTDNENKKSVSDEEASAENNASRLDQIKSQLIMLVGRIKQDKKLLILTISGLALSLVLLIVLLIAIFSGGNSTSSILNIGPSQSKYTCDPKHDMDVYFKAIKSQEDRYFKAISNHHDQLGHNRQLLDEAKRVELSYNELMTYRPNIEACLQKADPKWSQSYKLLKNYHIQLPKIYKAISIMALSGHNTIPETLRESGDAKQAYLDSLNGDRHLP